MNKIKTKLNTNKEISTQDNKTKTVFLQIICTDYIKKFKKTVMKQKKIL